MPCLLTLALGSCNDQRSCLSGGHQEIQRERGWIDAVERQQEVGYRMQGEKAQAEKAMAKQQLRHQKLMPGDVHLSTLLFPEQATQNCAK